VVERRHPDVLLVSDTFGREPCRQLREGSRAWKNPEPHRASLAVLRRNNFVPVLADVKVLPEHLAESRARLAGAWPR
jgi:hypothetical protein